MYDMAGEISPTDLTGARPNLTEIHNLYFLQFNAMMKNLLVAGVIS